MRWLLSIAIYAISTSIRTDALSARREYISDIWLGIMNGDIDPKKINAPASSVSSAISGHESESQSMIQSARSYVSSIWQGIVNGDIDPKAVNQAEPSQAQTAPRSSLSTHANDAMQPLSLDTVADEASSSSYMESVHRHASDIWAAIVNGDIDPRKVNLPQPATDTFDLESPSVAITAHAMTDSAMQPMSLTTEEADDESGALSSVRRYFSDIWASIVNGDLDPQQVDMPSDLEPVRAYKSEVLQRALDDLQHNAQIDAQAKTDHTAQVDESVMESANRYISDIWQHVLDGEVEPAKVNAHTQSAKPRPQTSRVNDNEGGSGGLHGHASQMKAEDGKCAGPDIGWDGLTEESDLLACVALSESQCTLMGCRWIRFTPAMVTDKESEQVRVGVSAHAADNMKPMSLDLSAASDEESSMMDSARKYMSDIWASIVSGDLDPQKVNVAEKDQIEEAEEPTEEAESGYVSDLWAQMMDALGAGSLRSNAMPMRSDRDSAQRVNAVMSVRSVEGVMNMRLSTLDVVLGVALFVTVALAVVQSYRCCIRRAQQGLSMAVPEMDRTPLLDACHKV